MTPHQACEEPFCRLESREAAQSRAAAAIVCGHIDLPMPTDDQRMFVSRFKAS
jgi:hypothetical protein